MIFLNNYNPVDAFDLEATLFFNLWVREGKAAMLEAFRPNMYDHPNGLELHFELFKRCVKAIDQHKT